MPTEPSVKRACVFIDGQNLFKSVKEAFGYKFPNFDVLKLANELCTQQGWQHACTYFYTGCPDARDDPFWNHFWTAKLAHMGKQGIKVFKRPLRYRNQTFDLPDGTQHTILVGQEKGIDVRIALDAVRSARQKDCDVILLLSQDQDLSEVADEVRVIAREHDRWLKIASAFPDSPTLQNHRGVNSTDWVRFDRTTYDRCIDHRDYRPARKPGV